MPRKAATAVANSNLVKTAFFGCDLNLGRIVSAIGSVGIPLSVGFVKVFLEGVPIFPNGTCVMGNEVELAEIMVQPYIRLKVNLGMGNGQFRIMASDLGYEYVKINAHYHT